MTALIKNIMKDCNSLLVFVNSVHYKMINEYWIPQDKSGISLKKATEVPPRLLSEKDDELIEKHAIMDVTIKSFLKSFIVVGFV